MRFANSVGWAVCAAALCHASPMSPPALVAGPGSGVAIGAPSLAKRTFSSCDISKSWKNQPLFHGSHKNSKGKDSPLTVTCADCYTKGSITASLSGNDMAKPKMRLDLSAVEAYMDLALACSDSSMYTINLYKSNPLSVGIEGQYDTDVVVYMDLVFSTSSELEMSHGGFYLKVPEGAFLETSLLDGTITASNFKGLGAKSLPVELISGDATLQANLRMRTECGTKGSHAGIGAGTKLGIYANLIEFVSTLKTGSAPECGVHATESWDMNVGAYAHLGKHGDYDHYSAVPTVSTTLLSIPKSTQCWKSKGHGHGGHKTKTWTKNHHTTKSTSEAATTSLITSVVSTTAFFSNNVTNTDTTTATSTDVTTATSSVLITSTAVVSGETSTAVVTSVVGETSTAVVTNVVGETSTAVVTSVTGETSTAVVTNVVGETSTAVVTNVVGETSTAVVTSVAGETSTAVVTNVVGETSTAVVTSVAGETSTAVVTNVVGETSTAVVTSVTGEASTAVVTSVAGETSTAVVTSVAGETSTAVVTSVAGEASTLTVYSTTVFTITSCAASVVNCPATYASAITVTTTVPMTETETETQTATQTETATTAVTATVAASAVPTAVTITSVIVMVPCPTPIVSTFTPPAVTATLDSTAVAGATDTAVTAAPASSAATATAAITASGSATLVSTFTHWSNGTAITGTTVVPSLGKGTASATSPGAAVVTAGAAPFAAGGRVALLAGALAGMLLL